MTKRHVPNIVLKEGFRPWEPSPEARLVEVLDRYNVPQVGVLEDAAHHYIFQCVEGQAGNWSLWTYHQVDTSDLAVLRDVEGQDAVDAFLARLFEDNRPFAAAVSSRDEGIVQHVLVTEGLHGREVFPAVAAALKQGISPLAEQLGVPL
jgi:hypothetical protein